MKSKFLNDFFIEILEDFNVKVVKATVISTLFKRLHHCQDFDFDAFIAIKQQNYIQENCIHKHAKHLKINSHSIKWHNSHHKNLVHAYKCIFAEGIPSSRG